MTHYISQQGLDELKKELKKRTSETRKLIAQKIHDAKELGDLSENFEYHDAKDQQALNESRVLELGDLIRDSVIIETKIGSKTIEIGTSFSVKLKGSIKNYQLVGSQEADPINGKISNESPIGRAFLGHKKSDVIDLQTPSGVVSYEIIDIE